MYGIGLKESKTLPKQRMNTIALEFLVDMIREILAEDEDGIVPLVPNAGEKVFCFKECMKSSTKKALAMHKQFRCTFRQRTRELFAQ